MVNLKELHEVRAVLSNNNSEREAMPNFTELNEDLLELRRRKVKIVMKNIYLKKIILRRRDKLAQFLRPSTRLLSL